MAAKGHCRDAPVVGKLVQKGTPFETDFPLGAVLLRCSGHLKSSFEWSRTTHPTEVAIHSKVLVCTQTLLSGVVSDWLLKEPSISPSGCYLCKGLDSSQSLIKKKMYILRQYEQGTLHHGVNSRKGLEM